MALCNRLILMAVSSPLQTLCRLDSTCHHGVLSRRSLMNREIVASFIPMGSNYRSWQREAKRPSVTPMHSIPFRRLVPSCPLKAGHGCQWNQDQQIDPPGLRPKLKLAHTQEIVNRLGLSFSLAQLPFEPGVNKRGDFATIKERTTSTAIVCAEHWRAKFRY